MDKQRLKYLFGRFMDKTILPEEQDELLQVIDDNHEENFSDILYDIIDSSGNEKVSLEEWTDILSKSFLADRPAKTVRSLGFAYRWAAAAAILLLVGVVSYVSLDKNKKVEQVASVIAPGTDKAVLFLEDGSSIKLDGVELEKAIAFNPDIQSVSNGEIVYNKVEDEETKVHINTLRIPKGGQFRVVLPDATVAWLNSDSELKFPSAFDQNSREVELKGEAYFEVTSYDKKWPFIVKSSGQKVEVLGTKFNVSAYQEDSFIKTSLLEGKVKVTNEGSSQTVILKPGQEAALNINANRLTTYPSEVEESIAWKEGLFVFNNEDIHVAMGKIARWYDVEVVYKGDFKAKALWGTASRSDKLESLLNTLQATRVAKFKIEGRRILVMH
ncbi:FecR family protein [Pedobacter xixiisoli]|nr:FecR family protein [Pedobacter xixiisoli]